MSKKERTRRPRTENRPPDRAVPAGRPSIPDGWKAALFLLFLTFCATYPLILSPSNGIYSPTDHISTDAYSSIAHLLWWPRFALWDLATSPLRSPLLCAPYSQFMSTSSLTGWVVLPVTLLTSPIFANNLLTWAGYLLSAFFAYLLVHHLTGRRLAGVLSGVLFAFCPYMLLRGYTTYDTIQAGWIPLYVLALFRFDEARTWKNAGLVAGSLLGAMLLSFPYYFVFLPILTAAYLGVRLVAHHRGRADRTASFLSSLSRFAGRPDLGRLAAALALVAVVFGLHYRLAVQPSSDLPRADTGSPVRRSIDQQWELRMATADYFVPVQQSAIFGGWSKGYWDDVWKTERRNSINSAAYVGYVALILAGYGIYRRRDWKTAFLAVVGALAFLTTLGPFLNIAGLQIPTPAWAMFQYASFVRRINAYKVYVQLAVSVLAGIGLSLLLERFRRRGQKIAVTGGLVALACLEYTIVPPAVFTDLGWTPEPYRWLSSVGGDPIVLEYPMRKAWGADYQGYAYYQMTHRKRLFNGIVDNSYIPPAYRAFWRDMEVPAAIADGNNQALLRHFGVRYVLRHYRVQSQKARWWSLPQPDFDQLPGLRLAHASPDFRREYRDYSPSFVWQNMPAMLTDPAILNHPHDYVWTDVYEVTLPPSDVMLTWDYRSPYPGSAEASEYFSVRLTEPERSFHPPAMLFQDAGRWTAILHSDNAQDLREQAATAKLPLDLRAWRMMKQDGKMEALNLLDRRQTFDLVFDAVSFEKVRRVEARVDGRRVKDLEIGAGPSEYRLEGFVLEPGARAILTFHATGGPSKVPDDQGGTRDATIAFHNFRVMSRP